MVRETTWGLPKGVLPVGARSPIIGVSAKHRYAIPPNYAFLCCGVFLLNPIANSEDSHWSRVVWRSTFPLYLAETDAHHLMGVSCQLCEIAPGKNPLWKSLRKTPKGLHELHFTHLHTRSPKRVKNESKKSLPRPPVPGVQKVRKSHQKESKTSQKATPFLTRFSDSFWHSLDPWDRRAQGDSFLTRFWLFESHKLFGQKSPETAL